MLLFCEGGGALPTGPCSLTHRLEEGDFKKPGGKDREKRLELHARFRRLERAELKWVEYLPPTDREQLDTQKEAQAHPTGTSRKIDILTQKHTNIHTLRTTIPAGYEPQCSCCHGDTLSC